MKDKSNTIWTMLLVVLAIGVILFIQSSNSSGRADKIPWRTDLTSAISEAKQSNKKVLMEFSTTWCGWCKKMSEETWSDPAVEKAMENYIPVKIDGDARPELVTRFQVDGYPAMRITDVDSKVLKSADGYMDAKRFLDWIGK